MMRMTFGFELSANTEVARNRVARMRPAILLFFILIFLKQTASFGTHIFATRLRCNNFGDVFYFVKYQGSTELRQGIQCYFSEFFAVSSFQSDIAASFFCESPEVLRPSETSDSNREIICFTFSGYFLARVFFSPGSCWRSYS